ncbi:MAG TPA: T9SS type A sorting domain-containing protein [Pricia sp.]|nr:T9SS type A sorting domain-containing protein [Pricia sp.]
MRLLYLSLFLLFTMSLSAQESQDFQKGTVNDVADVRLYPNPAFGGVVHVVTQSNSDKRITIYDVFGKVVLKDKISGQTLDITRLAPGVYVLQVNEGQKTMTRKLVVK